MREHVIIYYFQADGAFIFIHKHKLSTFYQATFFYFNKLEPSFVSCELPHKNEFDRFSRFVKQTNKLNL